MIKTKKKIIIDLDVVTVSIWDKKDEAKIMERVKGGLFYMVTPYILLEHLSKWSYRKLAEEITNFYETYSSEIVTAQNLLDRLEETKVSYRKLLTELIGVGVKEEDVVLVIIVSVFNLDYLVTFNRKHLKNNESKINEVLKKNGIKTINIVSPSEL